MLWPGMHIILNDGTKCSVCTAFTENVECMDDDKDVCRTVQYSEIREILPETRKGLVWVGFDPNGGKD